MAPVFGASVVVARHLRRRLGAGPDGFTLHIDQIVLEPGACVAVTGPSGCGKSTLLGLLALALQPEAEQPDARLDLAGADALALWRAGEARAMAHLRSRELGFVPQTAALLNYLSLRDNIALPLAIAGRREDDGVRDLAASLGIAAVLDRRPADVSVGQRQRAAIARAVVHRPPIVLADEPTASVHPTQADEILGMLREQAQERGTTLLMATHDAARAEAAGFTVAPCRPEGQGHTRFAWPPP